MAKSRDRGRDAFRRREKKHEQRAGRRLDRQQRRIKIFSIVVLVGLISFATFQVMAASRRTNTEAANWRLPKLNGKGYRSLASFKGKPTVVMFYSSSCRDCPTEIPLFVAAAKAHSDKANWVVVNTLETDKKAAIKLAKDTGLAKLPLLRDVGKQKGDLHSAFGAEGPFALVYYNSKGQQGNVQTAIIDAANFESYVQQVLRDPAPPPPQQSQDPSVDPEISTGDPALEPPSSGAGEIPLQTNTGQ